MEQSIVSVIIPVYNAQETIQGCIGSILGQSWQALEVLAVDDGSTDGSLALLRSMAEKDRRLKVLAKANGGVASARNMAVYQATGRYIQFVDSDDTLPPDATRQMVAAMEQEDADMVIAPYIEIAANLQAKRGFIHESSLLSREAFLDHLSLHPNSFYYAVLWNKLYRRDLIIKNSVSCDSRFPWGEDFDFNMQYYRYVNRVAALTQPVYHYNRQIGGLALDSVRQSLLHPLRSIRVKVWLQQRYDQLYREAGLYEKYRWVLKRYLFRVTISG